MKVQINLNLKKHNFKRINIKYNKDIQNTVDSMKF